MGRPKKTGSDRARNRKPALRNKILIRDDMIGGGKIGLLKLVDEHGSISAAARALGIGYRRAWYLLETVQKCFRDPLFATSRGGGSHGGARLTALGRELVERYGSFEADTDTAAQPFLDWIETHQADGRAETKP